MTESSDILHTILGVSAAVLIAILGAIWMLWSKLSDLAKSLGIVEGQVQILVGLVKPPEKTESEDE